LEERQSREGKSHLLLALPALIFLTVFFVYPMLSVFFRSLAGAQGISLEHYAHVVGDPVYLRIFLITVWIAALITAISLALAYPLAYAIATAGQRVSKVLMTVVLVPFLTDTLVRTYAWMVILGPNGLLNNFLVWIGLSSVRLLYNTYGILIGMTYVLLPYMILTLYSVMKGIDRDLLQAARSLGASDWQAFRRVFLPLSLPGVVGGALLVFVLALGSFVTPRLLGGARDQMATMVIVQYVDVSVNWAFASALTMVLLAVILLGFLVFDRIVGLKTVFEARQS
jgi:putative spermidine/putrescine transport system permease protein